MPERGLEVALLAWRELVVDRDEVGVRARELGLQLVDLAGTEVGVRVRMIAPLHELPDIGHAGGLEQLAELGELLLAAVRHHRDQVGALPGAAARPLTVQAPACGRLAGRLDGSSSLHLTCTRQRTRSR